MSAADLDESDVEAVAEVIRSGRLALGPKSGAFEQAMAEYVGAAHAIAVSSGTTALHIVVRAMGLGPGDEVLVPSFTFAASVNAILYEKAVPVFVDVEPETYCLDPEDLKRKVSTRTRAVMAVDIFGHPVEWDAILPTTSRYGLRVIDDSCEALGAEYHDRKAGQFGDAATFAFYPNKQITTGEGGIIVTNDPEMARTARSLRNQGRSDMGAWLEHERLGYNYRMNEMSAALGLSQLRRIGAFLEKRELVARRYTQLLSPYDWVRTQVVRPHARMSWFVFVITLASGLNRDRVIAGLSQRGVPSRGYFAPVHLQAYIKAQFGYQGGELPVTEEVAKRTLALPFHNNLREDEIQLVVAALADTVREIG